MRSRKSFARTLAPSLLCLAAFVSASFAATNPLKAPQGLAVDAKGNLYVANSEDNNILVFNPNYVLQPSRTITQGVSRPSGVAFDTQSNLWVANFGSSSVTEYTGGSQNTNAIVTNGISSPQAIAIDGLNNLWVENNNTNVTVYAPPTAFAAPSTLILTVTDLPVPIYGIAVGGGMFSFGGDALVSYLAETPMLHAGNEAGFSTSDNGIAMASDAKGDIYLADFNGSVHIQTVQGNYSEFLQLSFIPSGIAIDSVRGRVYFSNFGGNSIAVYSTAGKLLHTIQ